MRTRLPSSGGRARVRLWHLDGRSEAEGGSKKRKEKLSFESPEGKLDLGEEREDAHEMDQEGNIDFRLTGRDYSATGGCGRRKKKGVILDNRLGCPREAGQTSVVEKRNTAYGMGGGRWNGRNQKGTQHPHQKRGCSDLRMVRDRTSGQTRLSG